MACSLVLVVLTAALWIGTGLYVGGGIAGLSGTLTLMELYGPDKGYGNPALDDPPVMHHDPETGAWEPVNPNNPGNRVPQAFAIVRYILIAWAVVIFGTSMAFIIDSVRSEKVIVNRSYEGKRTSDSALSCTAWLAGYSLFLAVAWFVQAGFAVLPLLEYRITMQRCWDLENPNFAPTTKRVICVDLVQYGLVMFRETSDAGYALVCGPGGNYDPERGNLEGFCGAYSTTFAAFIMCFAGAGVGTIVMMLFAMHHGTNFAYLKVRRYEKGMARYYIPGHPGKELRQNLDLSHTPSLSDHSDYRGAPEPYARRNGANLSNPNYGVSLSDTGHTQRNPVPEVMSFPRYRTEEDDMVVNEMGSVRDHSLKYHEPRVPDGRYSRDDERSREYSDSDGPPSYDGHSDEFLSSKHGQPRRKHRHRNRYERSRRDRGSEHSWREESRHSDGGGRRRRRSEEDAASGRWSSDGRSSKVSNSKRRKSRRRQSSERLEPREESPTSDYYMTEDRQRRSSTRWG